MPGLTTKELSSRTWPDYVRFFSRGNGWDHCGCLAYHGLRPPRSVRLWSEKRDWALEVKRGMVEQHRTHGILVYAAGEAVGWCQFGGPGEFAGADVDRDAPWRVTCFCTDPEWRGRGVSSTALRAAVKAIVRRGGLIIEGHPVATVSVDDEGVRRMKEWERRRNQLIREHGTGKAEPVRRHVRGQPRVTTSVRGVGVVDAWWRTGQQLTQAGTVSMFEREGFEAVSVVRLTNRAGAPQPSFVVMRKVVG